MLFFVELESRGCLKKTSPAFFLGSAFRSFVSVLSLQGLTGNEGRWRNKDMNIVLIGSRCSGKSVIGRILSDAMGLKLVDTDQVLEERVGSPINDYVAENGWEAFRMIEKIIIRSISNHDRRVIATGGGAVLDWENVRILRQTGWVVWLRASVATLSERMMQDECAGRARPGLVGKNPVAEIQQVLRQRAALYERASDYVLDTDRKSPDCVAQEILESYQNHRCEKEPDPSRMYL
jgi:shikimate kinase